MKTSNFYLFVILVILTGMLLLSAYFMPDLKGQALMLVFTIIGVVIHAIDPGAPILGQGPPNQPQNAKIREE
jgi:hypothetical protein